MPTTGKIVASHFSDPAIPPSHGGFDIQAPQGRAICPFGWIKRTKFSKVVNLILRI
jgi:hypothetical protein